MAKFKRRGSEIRVVVHCQECEMPPSEPVP
jgi:hypothetical protein